MLQVMRYNKSLNVYVYIYRLALLSCRWPLLSTLDLPLNNMFKQLLSMLATVFTAHCYFETSHSFSRIYPSFTKKKNTCSFSQHISCPHFSSVPFTSLRPTQSCHHSIENTHTHTHACIPSHRHSEHTSMRYTSITTSLSLTHVCTCMLTHTHTHVWAHTPTQSHT